jgi:hypothetical protein
LHIKDGKIHRHGPRSKPCDGSDKPPLSAQLTSFQSASNTPSSAGDISPLAVMPLASSSSFIASSLSTLAERSSVFSHPHIDSALIKRIPKSARPVCASRLTNLLRGVTDNLISVEPWSDLLHFGVRVLQKPDRTGRRHNLASVIKKRTEGASPLDKQAVKRPVRKSRNDDELLAAAVTAKVEDGNIKAAIRLLCSEEKPAVDTAATFLKLLERHPAPSVGRCPAEDPLSTSALQVSEAMVLQAIRSFPAGSSGGPDGIRPQHILDLVSCQESGSGLLTAITAFVNGLLDGKCNPEVLPVFFGGRLIALEKKSGGIRPIAVGYTWRRIAAKCANAHAIEMLKDYLQPSQLGVGVPGGCEAAVHATRRFVESMPAGYCVVKLDFSNAFNCLHRDAMLDAVLRKVPGIYKFCHLAYCKPSSLTYDGRTIISQEGSQQGDPLGPVLFCSTIQPLLISLDSEFKVGYMDDLTLGGPEAEVARDVDMVRRKGEEIGLCLNDKKCEFISSSGQSSDSVFHNFVHLTVNDADLLGAPLTTGSAMDRALSNRCDDLSRAASRLRLIAAHDALILLRASFSAPKLNHTLRASPCSGHPALEKFDSLLRNCVCIISNTDMTDLQWIQASLPVRNGGLGIRRVSSLAPSAFLASAAGTRNLQDNILLRYGKPSDSAVVIVLAQWTALYDQSGDLCPTGDNEGIQRAWDKPCISTDVDKLHSCLTDKRDRARLLALAAPHSGDWLNALPISSCGLRLGDEAIRVAVGLRLGSKICEPHQCPCGFNVDPEGTHGLACRRSAGRSSRHHAINDLVWRALIKADVPSVKEPVGLLRSDGKRPDGLTQIPWQGGRCLTWDVTVTDTLADSYLANTSLVAGSAAEGAASRKEVKYQLLANSHTFVPLAFETFGPINSKGISFLSELGRRLTLRSGDKREKSFLHQRLSIAIQRFNAICFEGSFARHDSDS